MKKKRVCVFGSYRDLGPKRKEDIVKLGRLLAKKGFEVVSGGFGGTMEDVSRGAKEAGGKTVGITYYKWQNLPYKRPNKYIDKEIKTKNIFERIETMARKSDFFIVLPGGTGTMLELAACLELVNKGLMEPKPIIALGTYWKSVLERLAEEPVLSEKARASLSALSCRDLVTFVDTVEEAVLKMGACS
ncbi:MAG: LOG family protein [Omnitrophica bacterium]|nr:LOG family protein [Candidatus Omnitrophota bacterium]